MLSIAPNYTWASPSPLSSFSIVSRLAFPPHVAPPAIVIVVADDEKDNEKDEERKQNRINSLVHFWINFGYNIIYYLISDQKSTL
jgi:hypothetical protein